MKIEIRENAAVITGYVNVVERESRTLCDTRGKFKERVKAGTFKKALAEADNIELRFNHTRILGTVKDGTLKLKEDNVGLYAEVVTSDKEVIEKAKKKELRGWSFGFVKIKDSWEQENEIQKRTLEAIKLKEVSILDKTPAYIATSIEMRSEENGEVYMQEERSSEEDVELREFEVQKPKEVEKLKTDMNMYQNKINLLKIGGKRNE